MWDNGTWSITAPVIWGPQLRLHKLNLDIELLSPSFIF